jgi:hypothetical protein
MGLQIRLSPRLGSHEIETAVDNGQPNCAQPFLQCVHADQGLEHHELELSATLYAGGKK